MIQTQGKTRQTAAQEATALLLERPRQNALLLERIRRGYAADIGTANGAVRLRDTRSGYYMFAAREWEDFQTLYRGAEVRPDIFFLSDSGLGKQLDPRQFEPVELEQWLMEQDAADRPANPDFTFNPARLSDLDQIARLYQSTEFDRAYLGDIIRDNPSVCAYAGDTLAAFMLTHKDGETGPMIVLEAYRHRGLGDQLVRRISNILRQNGILPIGHIYPDNVASAHLHRKVGYLPCEKTVLWVYPRARQK